MQRIIEIACGFHIARLIFAASRCEENIRYHGAHTELIPGHSLYARYHRARCLSIARVRSLDSITTSARSRLMKIQKTPLPRSPEKKSRARARVAQSKNIFSGYASHKSEDDLFAGFNIGFRQVLASRSHRRQLFRQLADRPMTAETGERR